jgi:hypothetical protein
VNDFNKTHGISDCFVGVVHGGGQHSRDCCQGGFGLTCEVIYDDGNL